MADYQRLYTTLFNAISDALQQLDKANYGQAKELLIAAQQTAEDIYIRAGMEELS